MKMKYKAFLVTTLILLTAGAVWITSALSLGYLKKETERTEMIIEAEDISMVSVDNDLGKIDVDSWENKEIRLTVIKTTYFGEKELEKVDVDTEGQQELVIKTKKEEEIYWVSVEIKLTIPKFVKIRELTSEVGNIDVRGCRGNSSIRTEVGEIVLRDHTGDVKIDVGVGEITLSDIRGNVSTFVSSGDTRISDVIGLVRAEGENGDIAIEDVYDILQARTNNGDISFRAYNISDSHTYIRSENGNIRGYVTKDSDMEIYLSTENGDVSVSYLDMNMRYSGSKEISGTLNSGGKKLEMITSNGDVKLYGYELDSGGV